MKKQQQPEASLPVIVIQINGGLVNAVLATQPVRVVILDEDTEGGEDERIATVDGQDVYVHDYLITNDDEDDEVSPDGVAAILQQIPE